MIEQSLILVFAFIHLWFTPTVLPSQSYFVKNLLLHSRFNESFKIKYQLPASLLGCTIMRCVVTKGAWSPQKKSRCWVRTLPSGGLPQGTCIHQRIFVQPRDSVREKSVMNANSSLGPNPNCITSSCLFSVTLFRHCCSLCWKPLWGFRVILSF